MGTVPGAPVVIHTDPQDLYSNNPTAHRSALAVGRRINGPLALDVLLHFSDVADRYWIDRVGVELREIAQACPLVIANVSALRALPARQGNAALVEGYYSPGDGGGGDFVFDGTAIASAARTTAAISTASATTPIVITTSTPHGFSNGQAVLIAGVAGSTANGRWLIAKVTVRTFELVGSVGDPSGMGGTAGTASSVVVTTTAPHGFVAGQRVIIDGNSNPAFNASYAPIGISPGINTQFSVPADVAPGAGGSFGDEGRTVASSVSAGRWLRVQTELHARAYGARCDNIHDDSQAIQAMVDANPAGRFLLPGSKGGPVTIFMGNTPLVMKGGGWILEGGGSTYGAGGTTLRWNAGATGIIALNDLGAGTIRNLRLLGGERFIAAVNAAWPDAILPNFTDRSGANIFSRGLARISRMNNVVTATIKMDVPEPHTYVVGTQLTVAGIPSHPEMEGLHYVTAIGRDAGGRYTTFSYANSGPDVAEFSPAGATSSITSGSGSQSDAIVAGANYLKIENVDIEAWGRFGIHAVGDTSDYWADDISLRNVTIHHGRGIGVYIRGGDANASDLTQVNVQDTLVGGIFDTGFLGNTHIAENVSLCGGDYGSKPGPPISVASISCNSNLLTVTTATPHRFVVGQAVVLENLLDASYEPPLGSAVFVSAVPSDESFQCRFTRANGCIGARGTARTATGTEMFTAAGLGQARSGTSGSGFSYWIGGDNATRVIVNPYAEGTNGPAKFRGRTMVIGGIIGPGYAQGYNSFSLSLPQESNLNTLDGDLAGGTPGQGTHLRLRGGLSQEQPSSLTFLGHDRARPRTRWYLRDDPTHSNPGLTLARGNYSGQPRLAFYIVQKTFSIESATRRANVVTITTTATHEIAYGNFVEVSGVPSFNGIFPVTEAITDKTLQYPQMGSDYDATPGTGTIRLFAYDYPGDTHLSGEDGGSVRLNFSGGTGGVRFCDGAGHDVARFDKTGKLIEYNDVPTAARGVVAECAEASLAGQAAAIGTTTLYAVPSGRGGLYRVSYYLKVTTAASASSSVTLIVGWTDRDDSVVLTTSSASPANEVGGRGVLVGSWMLDVAGSTNITFATTYASSGATAMAYKLTLRLEAL
jgi:hypothetical protein